MGEPGGQPATGKAANAAARNTPAHAARTPVALGADRLTDVAARGVAVPMYDRGRLAPRVAHIGVGGFHRAHLAVYLDELAAAGGDWGIGGLGVLPADRAMAAALGPQDCLYTLIERGAGEPHAAVIGSLVDYRHTAGRPQESIDRLADPGVAIVSMTITEAGYALDGPGAPTFDLLAAALDVRRRSGAPVTVLSCDNLPGNGAAARRATLAAAARVDAALATWIEGHCSFPNSMVDRITPVTSDADRAWLLEAHGVVDNWPVVAEPFRQWVVEDDFAAGRPDWPAVGVILSDDVHAWELYKLRLLNAGHSCIAYLCALGGLTLVDEALADPAVRHFLQCFLADEAIPSLRPIDGHTREEYAATVVERFANPGVRDQIARLCIDGSAKFPTFLVPTIVYQLEVGGPVTRSALALAGWARYLATTPLERQAADASGVRARQFATAALVDPLRFLDYDTVFSATLREDARFRDAFVAGVRAIDERGALGALAMPDEPGARTTV